ncbi:hypothetical protein EWM64_g370 [Hericium alpestre]|uniref:2'-phosphotransferase n=1 Tax=Hericium alpestre TaxID=135208 RepID=A0A4Z0A9C3_9AGAM|nr:hypothetical protein EWM64_g370 [Hericium alpestre]
MSASSQQKGSGGKSKLRGLPKDSPEVRVSKTLSWILRHGAKSQGLYMRPDGFVRVSELKIVKDDQKMRYTLLMGPDEAAPDAGDIWWIRANQGHSMKVREAQRNFTFSPSRICAGSETGSQTNSVSNGDTDGGPWHEPQGMAIDLSVIFVHVLRAAIHRLGSDGVISGMRASAQILIYIDIQKALDDGILFFLSENGVVLTEGDSRGFLDPKYFSRVESRDGRPIEGWQPSSAEPATPAPSPPPVEQTSPAEEVKEAAS